MSDSSATAMGDLVVAPEPTPYPTDPDRFAKLCQHRWCTPLTPCLVCRRANSWRILPDTWEPNPGRPFPDPIPHIIPFGTVTLFAGAAGVGKTAMLAGFIRRWLDGKPIWGHATNRPTEFCYLAADRQWASHQIWFDAVGYPEIKHYSIADDPQVNLDRLAQPQNAYKYFLESLDRLEPKPGSHVIVDPMAPLFVAGEQNRQRDVAVTLLRFSRECRKRQINITACVHFGKQKSDLQSRYSRPMDRISGSGSFAGFSDTQIYMVDPEPPEQPYHQFGWRPRHYKEESFKVIRDDVGLFLPYTEADQWLRDVLDLIPEGRSIAISELEEGVFETLGMSRATLYRRLKDMKDAGLVEQERGRVVKVKVH